MIPLIMTDKILKAWMDATVYGTGYAHIKKEDLMAKKKAKKKVSKKKPMKKGC